MIRHLLALGLAAWVVVAGNSKDSVAQAPSAGPLRTQMRTDSQSDTQHQPKDANSHEHVAADARYAAAMSLLRDAVQFEVQAKQLPAFSIAVIDDEKIVWADGFAAKANNGDGVKNPKPITAETIYRVGSVSKLFTDVSVMQLVESGGLELDAPVQSALPNFAPKNPYGRPITLRQLMSHRSGLVREPPVGHYFDPVEPTLTATVESLNATSLIYPPETRTKYSNAGIAVVGAVVESITGKTYSQHIEQSIFQPLGMSSSSFVNTPEVDQRLAPATMWTLEGRRFPAPQFALGTAPAGNMYSSVIDLARFIRCLHKRGQLEQGQLLKPETLELMFTPGKEANGHTQGFGLGFHVNELEGHRRVGHGGAVYGCATQLEVLPDERLGVAAVAALDCANGTVERLANYALTLMLAQRAGKALPAYPRTMLVPPERARALVGEYVAEAATAQVAYLGGRLYLNNGVFRSELRMQAIGGELIIDDVISYGTPVRSDSAGKLVIGDKSYTRLTDEPPAPCKESWEGLIGEYGWDHDILFILEDRGRLVALIEWFYAYPITEIGPDEFAFPDYGLYHGEKLYFKRDDSGQASQVVAAEVPFMRREIGTRDGETFKIKPVRAIEELRSQASAAKPPIEHGDFQPDALTELSLLAPDLALDIRYATTNNFAGSVFYKQARAFLQRPAAEAVARAQQRLKPMGLGLLIHDAYRPWSVTKMFWEATPAEMKDFVANPANGSRHNRGCAVDVSLMDLTNGKPITMVSGYDEFSTRAFPGYPGGTSRQRWHRDLLRRTLETEGFSVYEYEWWHFDYADWKKYRIGNVPFEAIGSPGLPK